MEFCAKKGAKMRSKRAYFPNISCSMSVIF